MRRLQSVYWLNEIIQFDTERAKTVCCSFSHHISWELWELNKNVSPAITSDRIIWTKKASSVIFLEIPYRRLSLFCISPQQSCFFPHQLPAVPQSQPNKLRRGWLMWAKPSEPLSEDEEGHSPKKNSQPHTLSAQSSFTSPKIYKWQGAENRGRSVAAIIIGCLLPAIFTAVSENTCGSRKAKWP